MPKKVKIKNKKGLPRPEEHPDDHFENDAPTEEYRFMNSITSRDPSNPDSTPGGLKGMSELGALAWVRKNCKFAKDMTV